MVIVSAPCAILTYRRFHRRALLSDSRETHTLKVVLLQVLQNTLGEPVLINKKAWQGKE